MALASGGSDQTIDFGYYAPVTIGNFVWNDLNGNGVQDVGEPGIPGVVLNLSGEDGLGNPVTATSTTDGTGYYQFTQAPGTYSVSVAAPGGYVATAAGQGTAGTDSNVSPSDTEPVELASGGSDQTIDFGFYAPVTIGNFVWNDLNGNGVQDSGEPGLAGVVLNLSGTDGLGNPVTATATTDGTGYYQFTQAPGTYTVSVAAPVGYAATVTGQGTAGTDSNVNPSGTTPVALASGGSDQTIDFGFVCSSTPVVVCPPNRILNLTGGSGGTAFFCTYTPGGWGAAPSGGNPGARLANNFATVYPGGVEIGIPGSGGYSLKFTSAAAIEAYLPAGSTPGALNADATNPLSSSAGVLGGHVLALTLNLDFNTAGITPNVSGQIRDLVYTDPSSLLSGKTVGQILAIANTALGGGGLPPGVSFSTLCGLLTSFNEGFDNCATTPWASTHLLPASQQVDTTPAATGYATATDTCDTNPTVSYTDAVTSGACGGYEITRTWTAINARGNSSTCAQTITVVGQGAPTVSVNSGTICAGDVITLTASGASGTVSYLWSNGATTQSITVSPSVTTTYSVTVTAPGGCSASATGTVTVSPSSQVAGTFNFAGSSGTTGSANTRTYTDANGVSVKVTGFSRSAAGVWAAAYVGAYSGGLGITDVNENGSAPGHTVDNVGNDNYLLFEFSKPVIVDSAALGYVTTDSDLSVRIGTFTDPYNNHITLSDAALAAFGHAEENAGGSSTRTANVNASGVIGNALVIAASLTDKASADQFKLLALHTLLPICYSPVSVGNFVWNDVNQNGIQDSGETGINGVKLTLSGTSASGGSVSLTTTTAGNGAYLFSGLEPGTYTVNVDVSNFNTGGALAGYSASPALVGSNRAVDSNVRPSGTAPAALPSGASDLTLDFGFYVPPPPPPACVPSTFEFSGSSALDGTDGNTRVYTVNGITVRASAFSRDRASGTWARGYLGAYSGGLGVTDSGEGNGSGNAHTVDNVGGRDNFVLFEFSQPVVVNRAYLGYVVEDSDLSIWMGNVGNAYSTTQMLSDAYLGGLTGEENATSTAAPRWAAFNAGQIQGNVLVIAAQTTDTTPEDNFKIDKLDICAEATPPPPPVDCVTSTFNFNGSSSASGSAGNVRTYTVGGVSVKVSAFSRTTGGSWAAAYLGAYSGGLGVTDSSEGDGSGDLHTVDNVGRLNYVMFEFSQPVVINRAYLGYVVGDSDLSAWIGTASNPYANHITLSDSVLNSLGAREDNDTTSTGPRWANLNDGEVMGNVLVIAASVADDSPEDRFKIQKLEICAASAPTVPSPWTAKDIGCTVSGHASASSGSFTVKGAGADVWGTGDGFRYVYQPASGDCLIIARVMSVQNTDLWAKAGIMIRETLNEDSKHCSMFLTPGNGAAFQRRATTGGTSVNTNVTGKAAPHWLKLVRSGKTITGYYSANGTTWTVCGSQKISMTSSVYIGLAVSSHEVGTLCTATFDNVTAAP